MKRMVENSEKIEELVGAVEVNNDNVKFNGGLTTSNITTPGGISFKLIDEEDYNITDSGIDMSSFSTINLGVALVVSAGVAVSVSNGEYTIMTFNNDKLNNLDVIQISGAPVCNVYKHENSIDNTISIRLELNKNNAEYAVTDYYRFSFIFGCRGQELWEDY